MISLIFHRGFLLLIFFFVKIIILFEFDENNDGRMGLIEFNSFGSGSNIFSSMTETINYSNISINVEMKSYFEKIRFG